MLAIASRWYLCPMTAKYLLAFAVALPTFTLADASDPVCPYPQARTTEIGSIQSHPGYEVSQIVGPDAGCFGLIQGSLLEPIELGKTLAIQDVKLAKGESLADSEGFDLYCKIFNQKDRVFGAVIRKSDIRDGNKFKPLRAWEIDFQRLAFIAVPDPSILDCRFEDMD